MRYVMTGALLVMMSTPALADLSCDMVAEVGKTALALKRSGYTLDDAEQGVRMTGARPEYHLSARDRAQLDDVVVEVWEADDVHDYSAVSLDDFRAAFHALCRARSQ